MNQSDLHIISFNIPYPANYGGVIDVYYRLKALSEQNINITLHCFDYGREHQPLLKQLCKEVHYYTRTRSVKHLFSAKPFIVQSRLNEELLNNLGKDNAPILFEGLHTCGYLSHSSLKDRYKMVRTHNIEHHYYKSLFQSSGHPFFIAEALKLNYYESNLKFANQIITISDSDHDYFTNRFPNVIQISSNHPFKTPQIKTGSGEYALYHGNLSVPENIKSANYLIKNIIPNCNIPFIIAGKTPTDSLKNQIKKLPNVTLIDTPNDQQLFELIQNAQMHVLPTFQATGLKLKLLYALYNGRHCIVNEAMVEGTNLASLCHVTTSTKEMITAITDITPLPLTEEEKSDRSAFLDTHWSNEKITEKWLQLLNGYNESCNAANPS